MKLGVAFGWHSLHWEELLALARRAEALGYAALYADGDVSMLGKRRDADVLDGWTVTTALLAQTTRLHVGSIRLVHHWNAARLAQATVTHERLFPGRSRFFVSMGDRPEDLRFGLPVPPVGARIRWLDEMLDAVRALWRGESVSRDGEFVRLDGARVRPVPPGGAIPIEIGAKGRPLLGVVARHADAWNINLPPIPARVATAAGWLADACAREGRDPARIARRMWIFTRVQERPDPAGALAEFRRLNPWFDALPDAEIGGAIVAGDASHCARRLADIREELDLSLPVVDLSGLDAPSALRALESLPAGDFD